MANPQLLFPSVKSQKFPIVFDSTRLSTSCLMHAGAIFWASRKQYQGGDPYISLRSKLLHTSYTAQKKALFTSPTVLVAWWHIRSVILRHLVGKMHDSERVKSTPQLTTPQADRQVVVLETAPQQEARYRLPRQKGRREGHQVPAFGLQDSLGSLYNVRQ